MSDKRLAGSTLSEQPTCCKCGKAEDHSLNEKGMFKVELRPYGPGGADICFECAMASPEDEARAKSAFVSLLNAAHAVSPTGTAVIGDGHDRGPDPL